MNWIGISPRAAILCAAALLAPALAQAGSFQAIYHFAGGDDGNVPTGSLLRDAAGNLYGVTSPNNTALGTVFKLTPAGVETVLYDFRNVINEASKPVGGVVMDAAGNLYGEAKNGGSLTCAADSEDPDCGSIYKLAPDGTMTTIYHFQGAPDGGVPQGGLTIDSNGNLYGVTSYGGTHDVCQYGCGTVFKLTPGGTETILHSFASQTDGSNPAGNLIRDKQGNLTGTTMSGGNGGGYIWGYGTVFRLAKNGAMTILYAFQGGADGRYPLGGVVPDVAGNLYGTTMDGGGTPGEGLGVVYRLATDGTETVLHAFGTASEDGKYPQSGVLIDKKGDLYGTTLQGGRGCKFDGCGTVFKVASDGAYTKLLMLNATIAHYPQGGFVQDARGNLFGTAIGPYHTANLGLVFTMRK